MMAKNVEARYQSALGIEQYLEICLYQLKHIVSIEAFELGQRDAIDRFLISEKLKRNLKRGILDVFAQSR
jgi:hypothetical protein